MQTSLESQDGLVALLRTGDRAAWRRVFTEHGPMLLGYAIRMLKSRSLAEDVVQDALTSAWRKFETYDGRAPLKSWLCRIVRNRAIDELRRRRRFVDLPEDDPEASYFDAAGNWADGCPTWTGRAEEKLDAARRLEQVREAMDRLPHHYREVLLLKEVHGFNSPEICAALDISQGNLRIRLHRARKTLRAEVIDGGADPTAMDGE